MATEVKPSATGGPKTLAATRKLPGRRRRGRAPPASRRSGLALLQSGLAAVALSPFCFSFAANAQTVGTSPPTSTTTINVTTGLTTVAGSTAIATLLATNATNVTGGTLTFISPGGPAPGPITVQTGNGNALQANGGTITATSGNLSILTQGKTWFGNEANSIINAMSGQESPSDPVMKAIGGR